MDEKEKQLEQEGGKQTKPNKGNGNGKGSRKNRNYNNKSGRSKSDRPSGKTGGAERNPWELYAVNDTQAAAVASVPFNVIPGITYPWVENQETPPYNPDTLTPAGAPGAMVLSYIPTPGYSEDATSAINMAARQMYAYIRRSNSGARNYEAPDLMLYVLAMEDIYTEFFENQRVYGLCNTYYFMNRFMPDLLVRAAGFNPDIIRQNMAQVRYKLNLLAEKINSLAVPKYFKSFIRRSFVANQIFSDSDSKRSGIYIYRKSGYWIYQPVAEETGGRLHYVLHQQNASILDRLDVLDQMISAVITDDDMNLMGGDIIKAFGEGGLYSLAPVPADYVVNPVYDEQANAQIENSRSLLVAVGEEGLNINQRDNTLLFEPVALTGSSTNPSVINQLAQSTRYVLNSHVNEPTYKEVLEWTRVASIIAPDGKPTFGAELLNGYYLYYYGPSGSVTEVGMQNVIAIEKNDGEYGSSATTSVAISKLHMISQFDWHPAFYTYVSANVGSLATDGAFVQQPLMDLKVYTFVDKEILKRINESAQYSLYYSPLY